MYIGDTTDINSIEARLWKSADNLRANSSLASNQYFMPVMGLVFLRHAYKRYLDVKERIEPTLPTRDGKPRPLNKEDFSSESAIFLKPEAQFDYFVNLPEEDDIQQVIIDAMQSIEDDYSSLEGVLPKVEYREIPNDVLHTLVRDLNPDELKNATGDVFGRIYEYFLTQFADQAAHDGGEFYTPVSLVSFIAHVLEPTEGVVLDPACGSGGMFVQSAHFLESIQGNPNKKLTFKGIEKNKLTTHLAKMNLAVHGLEGDIAEALTYYSEPHDLFEKASYVMANPPFNVDEINAEKIKNDRRLKFGLPGVNDSGSVSNGNYVWISYFYSYLNEKGRAGFVMSSQASSAGKTEAKVREQLIKTGDVEAMVAIRGGFFYTRGVPCELWFFNRNKPKDHKDKVLMLDARNVYRKVTRTVNDFSPEQMKNLLSIVWLYRGETEKFTSLVHEHLSKMLDHAAKVPNHSDYRLKLIDITKKFDAFLKDHRGEGSHTELRSEIDTATNLLGSDLEALIKESEKLMNSLPKATAAIGDLVKFTEESAALADKGRDIAKQVDLVYRHTIKLRDICTKELGARTNGNWNNPEITKLSKELDVLREDLGVELKQTHYFHKQAEWLTEKFPKAKLQDIDGLVKLVDHKELEENDWSLTPGRYVGVAPEIEDEDFDFEESLRELHIELEGLNEESVELAKKIKDNFDSLGI